MRLKGFTLIEIVVVLLILGVLVALALPNIFSWVEQSNAPEATMTIRSIADTVDGCIATGKTAVTCFSNLNNLSAYRTTNFFYNDVVVIEPGYFIIAYRYPPFRTVTKANQNNCGAAGSTGTSFTASIILCRDLLGKRTFTSNIYSNIF